MQPYLSQDVGAREVDTTSILSPGRLARARPRNRHWAEALGWGTHIDRIVRLLGFTTYTPTERMFAEGVARWQRSHGGSVDGILGPNTWRAMRGVLGRAPGSATPNAGSSRGTLSRRGLSQHVAETATEEWQRWGEGTRKETDPRMRGVLRDYWRKAGVSARGADERVEQRSPWSAAFVSWVMHKAGAGDAFRYAAAHQRYIAAAKRNREEGRDNPFRAYRTTERRPQVGDLVCADRPRKGGSCGGATYDNIDAGFTPTHCDVVTEVGRGRLTVVGGNVGDSVGRKRVRTDHQGYVIPDQGRCRYFAVIGVHDAPGAGSGVPVRDAPGAANTLGTLSVQDPSFRYTFTPEDALWTARFLWGEDDTGTPQERAAVLWAVFNRYGLGYHRRYPTFWQFLRVFSSVLKPTASQKHRRKQETPWAGLPEHNRTFVLQALRGGVANPFPEPVSNADNFGNTAVYFRRRHKRLPTEREWAAYNDRLARQKGWLVVGRIPGVRQFERNTFFITRRLARRPPYAVRIGVGALRGQP